MLGVVLLFHNQSSPSISACVKQRETETKCFSFSLVSETKLFFHFHSETERKFLMGARENEMSNFTKLHLTQEILQILPVFSQFM